MDFNADMQATAGGEPVSLTIPASATPYTFLQSVFPFGGIPSLTVYMDGATLTDDGDGGAGAGPSYGVSVGIGDNDPQIAARIQTALKGATSVTFVTAGDAALVAGLTGRWIAITAGDQQGSGAPPNPVNCEYRQMTSVGTTISFAAPLKFNYPSTWPTYNTGSSSESYQGGAACIYLMPEDWGNTDVTYRGGTCLLHTVAAVPDPVGRQTYAKGRLVRFHDVVSSGDGHISVTQTQEFTLSGSRAYFPTSEMDKFLERVNIIDGATWTQPFIQSSAAGILYVNNGIINNLNGTAARNIIRGADTVITSLKLGPLGYGQTIYYDQIGGSIGSITWTPPQYRTDGYTMANGLVAPGDNSFPWEGEGNYLILVGSREWGGSAQVTSLTDAGAQTTWADSFPDIPGNATNRKVGPHPCLSLRLRDVTGGKEALEYSRPVAYGMPWGSYAYREFDGLTGTAEVMNLWDTPTLVRVTVTSAAAGTLKLFGQFDNYPHLDENDDPQTDWNPTVDLSVAGVHDVTIPPNRRLTGTVTPFCASTSAVFSVEIITDQGIDQQEDTEDTESASTPRSGTGGWGAGLHGPRKKKRRFEPGIPTPLSALDRKPNEPVTVKMKDGPVTIQVKPPFKDNGKSIQKIIRILKVLDASGALDDE
jgi:ribonuclease HI